MLLRTRQSLAAFSLEAVTRSGRLSGLDGVTLEFLVRNLIDVAANRKLVRGAASDEDHRTVGSRDRVIGPLNRHIAADGGLDGEQRSVEGGSMCDFASCATTTPLWSLNLELGTQGWRIGDSELAILGRYFAQNEVVAGALMRWNSTRDICPS